MRSIRTFLVVVILSTICLVNFLAALHGYRSSLQEADALLKRQLHNTALLLSGLDFSDHPPLQHNPSPTFWFQIWDGQGLLQYKSDNAPAKPLTPDTPQAVSPLHRISYDGFSWQALAINALDRYGQPQRIVVAERADTYSGLMEKMILESILPIIWVLPLLGLLIWLIVSFGLHPMRQLAKLLSRRHGDDFNPLPNQGYPEELTVLVNSTNELLSSLAAAFERERRFTADAAHELRTPLASLKVNLHNLIQNPEAMDPDDTQALVASVERMGHSIEQLLALYRTSPAALSSSLQLVEITSIARQVIANLYPMLEQKHQQIELVAEPVSLRSDEFAIETLLRNLIDNASKYTPKGGQILVTVKASTIHHTQGIVIAVEDTGPGIPTESYKRVFDRFYRLGGDRHPSKTMGSGLGLSIVDHIARLHEGEVMLGRSDSLGGLKVTVYLQNRFADKNPHAN